MSDEPTNNWLKNLEINDKFEIQQHTYSKRLKTDQYEWKIATITGIEQISNEIKLSYSLRNGYRGIKCIQLKQDHSIYHINPLNTNIHSKCNSDFEQCSICKQKFCKWCDVNQFMSIYNDNKYSYHCKKCDIMIEKRDIYNAIYGKYIDKEYIVDIICEYSIGFQIECNNISCHNLIDFDSKFEFIKGKKDEKGNKIYYYTTRTSVGAINYGLQRAIFCSQCTANTIKKCNYCYNKDIPNINHKVRCKNHPDCIVCNVAITYSYEKCKICDNYYHSSRDKRCGCRYQCKNCIIPNQLQSLRKILTDILCHQFDTTKHVQIIQDIANFASGYIVNCVLCQNEIALQSELDLYTIFKTDDAERFYHYTMYWQQRQCQELKTISIFNRQYTRIFCRQCTKHKLIKCGWSRFNKYCDFVEEYEGLMSYKKNGKRVCYEHIKNLCVICDKIKLTQDTDKCLKCNNYFCRSNRFWTLCGYKMQCKNCIISGETMKISSILKDIAFVFDKLGNDDEIIQQIAHYAIGYVINCVLCQNEIVINDEAQLEYNIDLETCQSIHHYEPDIKQQLNTVSIFNKNIRIFCVGCTKNTLIAKCNWCNTKDIADNLFIYQQNGIKTCPNHMMKGNGKLNKYSVNTKWVCYKCLNEKEYELQCRQCIIRKEQKLLFDVLWEIIDSYNDNKNKSESININSNVVQIIAHYSSGIYVTCCNVNCEEELCFDSEQAFNAKNINEIYHYDVIRGSKEIYHMKIKYKLRYRKIRIFCKNCSKSTLKTCQTRYCTNKDIGKKINGIFICRLHRMCSMCYAFYDTNKDYKGKYNQCDRCSAHFTYRRPSFFFN